ncbi:MAG: FHA domain-containing protein [Myxococcota bacterium]
MYKLVIEDDEGSRQTVPVIRDEITIGRKEGNTIRLTERNVSRQHARVVRDDGEIYVEDVKARYGIKKNGSKIDRRAVFAPGDVIAIGDYNLTLEAKKAVDKPGPNGKPAGPPAHRDLSEEKTRVTTRLDSGSPEEKASASSEGTEIMPAMPAKLVVISSNFAGQEFPLKNKEMVIGRGDDCDIIIDHRSVSTRHAKIVREAGGKYQIVDLNSKNGITVGGEEYRSTYLKRGDVVELGHVKFRFVEPGENYVFTPQPSSDVSLDTGGGLSTGVIVGTVAAVAIILAAGVFFMMSGDDEADSKAASQAVAEGASGDSPSAADTTTGAAADEKSAAADDEGDKAARNVSEAIAQSQQNIDQGELDRAMGRLESAKQFLDPSPEQADKIDEMLAEARNEQPFRRAYESAKSNLDSENFISALERLEEIPSHSVFSALVEEEGLGKDALSGLLTKAEGKLAEGDEDDAKMLAEEALVFDSENARAQKILDSLAATEPSEPVASAKTRNEPSGSGGSGSTGGSRPPQKSKPTQPEVTREEARELYKSAAKKLMTPDKNGAIRDCKQALKGGYTNCYRVLGVAYKQIGQTDQACRYFKKYLGTNPSNASNVQRQMDKMGCN